MRLFSSLFSKILFWFFMNLAVVAALLVVFFAFQSQIDLHAMFGWQASDRLRTAGRLITRELRQTPHADWSDVLARHAEIHQVDFAILLSDGIQSLSKDMVIPEAVLKTATGAFQPKPSTGEFSSTAEHTDTYRKKPRFIMRTKNPTRYWTGVRIRVPLKPSSPPVRGVLLAVSDSISGNGFFFDPLPWMIVAVAVMLISVVLWVPFVGNMTRSLARMTRATEAIAKGKFDVYIDEPRSDEIGRLARAINHMTSRLRGFVNGQKSFLGNVAHELGSPIARIQLGLGILEQRVATTHQKQLGDVMEDVTHMSNLVNELLSFSRAEMDTALVSLKPTDLLPVIQREVQRERRPASEIITHIDPGIRVVADPELLARALANIIRNAVKYGGDAGPIHISAKKEGRQVSIEVSDLGPGVPDDLVDQLFQPFFRTEPSRDPDSGGVGLGLAIVKTCVETCNGTVSARNVQPKGFAVTVTLTSAGNHR